MKSYLLIAFTAFTCLAISCSKKRSGKPRVLVFSKTAGFVHSSIPTGVAAIQKLGAENGFDVDTTQNAEYFNEDSLKKYAAVIFLSTTGNVLNHRQEIAFERYIQAGGGYVGIHAATDTEYDWGWYGRLVGGYFLSHPRPQQAKFTIKDKSIAATSFFTDTIWQVKDELYNFKKLNPETKVILTIDETSYEGGANGANHPMSWYHDYDGGRAFYTALGHLEELYADPTYLKHLLGGIQYAMGDNEELNYSKAKSQYPPDDDRFTKTQLSQGEFFEPTEITVLPNLDVLIVQRRGEILLYKNETKKIQKAGLLNVYWKATVPNVNAEEGLMGLAKDPNFEKNNWVYMFYSPIDSSVNRLSRFTLKNDTIDMASEKTVLEVKSQRNICCHTGGSIAFGPGGLLYVSTGDNSTPFDEPGAKYVNSGFGPMNDLPGRQQYDARRSSSNTNDLRGKILRIKINDDATYSIPDGNLFPKGTDKTRPEIFVMGNRNPYRISVDQKNGNLYWGEVGPDAANDSSDSRGPKGYDEVNQARKAGYFGWPLFVGNNYAYRQYDYATGQAGPAYDPQHPVNDSKNNTGLNELPSAQPAFIWYPYGASGDFPQVGTGGRNAMAGPVYYTDMYPKETRLPDYYNGKLIIYDWIRGWIKAVTLLPNGDFDKMEPFLSDIKVNALIDMEVGPDGKLYFLEYGNGWFSQNPDAGLFRIDFNSGNRAPKIKSIAVDKTSGNLPFTVKATVDAVDPEKDKLSYNWNFGDGKTKQTETPEVSYTFDTPGDYKISVVVKDSKGDSSISNMAAIYAGNEMPVVSIEQASGNRSFYLPGKPVGYNVIVKDNDTAKIDNTNLYVSVDYVEGFDKAGSSMGHQQGQALLSGKSLTQSLDCKGCHKEAEKSIGPSFMQVSEKYQTHPDATNYLSQKIVNGSKGVWGETAMASHPNMSKSDLSEIVSYVLSLAKKESVKKSLPPAGNIIAAADKKPASTMVISASYTDKGGINSKALTGSSVFSLPSNTVAFKPRQPMKGFTSFHFNSTLYYIIPQQEGWFGLDSIDLTDVGSLSAIVGWQNITPADFELELHLDAPDGKLLGKGKLSIPKKDKKGGLVNIPIEAVGDGKFHALYFVYKPQAGKVVTGAGISAVRFNAK
ncbi:ThuA domain-containing protein [Terrimonas pollutisoli]|uniref:ThuA domain-containing protein n=1 Tax=Terrimonas pollutisoli TaxID=3034147 RepID=UPI0023EC216B|nr:ThuA domain-containing protein [Terrimonas sp. H1YJ31]